MARFSNRSGLAFDAIFRLRLTANNGALMLTLSASELAFIRTGLHSIVAGSH